MSRRALLAGYVVIAVIAAVFVAVRLVYGPALPVFLTAVAGAAIGWAWAVALGHRHRAALARIHDLTTRLERLEARLADA